MLGRPWSTMRSTTAGNHAATLSVVATVALASLAGCLTERPGPEVTFEPAKLSATEGGTVSVVVGLVNQGSRTVTGIYDDGCGGLRVWAEASGERFPFVKDDASERLCTDAETPFALAPGEAIGPERFTLDLAQARWKGDTAFAAGRTYPVLAEVAGRTTDWESTSSTELVVRASQNEPLPRLKVVGPADPIPPGTDAAFDITFENTADRSFTFTSSDSCPIKAYAQDARGPGQDVELWRADGPQFCAQALTPVEVAPGEQMAITLYWDGTTAYEEGEPVAPGSYAVVARFKGFDHSWDADGTTMAPVAATTGDSEDATGDDEAAHGRIVIAPANVTLERGQEHAWSITYTNDRTEPFRFEQGGCDVFRVTVGPLSDGSHVALRTPGSEDVACPAVVQERTVEPGESMRTTVTWNGADRWQGDYFVAPGTYRLSAAFASETTSWDVASHTQVTVV